MKKIDISKYQGVIDWKTVSENEELCGVIMRATKKNGQLDDNFKTNYKGIVSNFNIHFNELEYYKLSYAVDYATARIEAFKTIYALDNVVNDLDFRLWLDLEPDGIGRQHTTREAEQIITAYIDACRICGVKFGLYINRTYALNVVSNEYLKSYPVWLARYNSVMGNDYCFKPVLWQFTSKGRIDGIKGDVDINEVLT